ncbi:MAG TPA: SPFH domain-containing protein, partial [Prosthecobacter sp.]|nr:SPFH domain-containing protein [Prosthecobacter sp.]
ILLNLVVHLSAREIMTTARENLRAELHRRLQAALNDRQSGLSVTQVYLRDIHPPVTVAPAFQEVISAMEEKEALLYEGEAYRRDVITRSRGDAGAVRITARSAAERRLLQAQGQAQRFNAQRGACADAPDLYQWREGFRVMDETLSGAKKAIFDASIRGKMPMHVDLRKVLNPDFIDIVPPKPQTLVPRPAVSRDAFDLDIEGYLRMDRGEVPAVEVRSADEDNLLKPQSREPTP